MQTRNTNVVYIVFTTGLTLREYISSVKENLRSLDHNVLNAEYLFSILPGEL